MMNLIEQLREMAKSLEGYPATWIPLGQLLTNAADEIDRLEKLVADQAEDVEFLRKLEAAGVDNWEGYDIAVSGDFD